MSKTNPHGAGGGGGEGGKTPEQKTPCSLSVKSQKGGWWRDGAEKAPPGACAQQGAVIPAAYISLWGAESDSAAPLLKVLHVVIYGYGAPTPPLRGAEP
jgi:hypothetical protein